MELEFRLPIGYVDGDGRLHDDGSLRLARAIDEINALAHPRVEANPAYLPVVVLSRVVTRLGSLPAVTEDVIGDLAVRDFQFLEELYLRLNGADDDDPGTAASCPRCGTSLVGDASPAA